MAESPGETELARASRRVPGRAGNERRDCSEVIGIGRVAQAEERADGEHEPERASAGQVGD
ncbi:hypothetical protein BH20ACT14_BH20ACT14_15770 [soil metagenome]